MMAEYIEREALLKAIDTERDRLVALDMIGAEHILTHNARRIIEEAPAADVVEVVRCKDCKHLGKAVRLFAGDAPVDVASCTMFKMSPRTLNEFCSCGERRGEE